MDDKSQSLHVVLWGTYDTGKPRVRLIRKALASAGVQVTEIHADVWGDVEDKSQLSGAFARARRIIRWLGAYPTLLRRYRDAPPHDVVLVGYLGILDVLMIRRAARKRGVPVVWDAFLSIYDTVVQDRNIVGPTHPMASLIRRIEAWACRLADRVVLDTQAHAALFRELYSLPAGKTGAIMVGAESQVFSPGSTVPTAPRGRLKVLFYGQFIPLHGIGTIVEAARLANGKQIDWILIGQGQEADRIAAMVAESPITSLRWILWVPYEELAAHIREADICLGVFGTTDKAGRVIPNKVFQILAAGRPLVTRDGPAIRELIGPDAPGVRLVPPGDPSALLSAIEGLGADLPSGPLHLDLTAQFSEDALGKAWRMLLEDSVAAAAQVDG